MKKSRKIIEAAPEKPGYQRRVPFLLGAISNLMGAGASRLYREAFSLGLGEARLLYVLGYEADLTAKRASQIMGVDKGATSRSLAVLEGRGLVTVTVHSGDGRQKVIDLTPAGRQVRDGIMAIALEREKRLMAAFSAEEAELLSDFLQRLLAHVPTVRVPVSLARPALRPAKGPRRVKR